MGELPPLFDRWFGGTETWSGLGLPLHSCVHMSLTRSTCPLGQRQDPISEVLGTVPLGTTADLCQALFHLLWEWELV